MYWSETGRDMHMVGYMHTGNDLNVCNERNGTMRYFEINISFEFFFQFVIKKFSSFFVWIAVFTQTKTKHLNTYSSLI